MVDSCVQPAVVILVRRAWSFVGGRGWSYFPACVARMAELQAGAEVWTLDAQFRVYRKNHRQMIPLIIPPDT